ncbi:MAG: 2,3-cyclic 3-phosphodiesterase [Pseudomonadota bacterium]|nr:2,3-cyclic 3-phosphodiesterase [Pseudomonadota bacterium]MDQ5903733.1 2,3-cyclic 3-phosphodiesterase [Pseudomonadota bacterium]MDQ5914714.1 2,3-cyclic 3-phosphodiesterase [Pseudomonadota bacterium]MDQ5918532.1 2,3-cyclic 3-phosphodiesterase [Pseudomonadota bacterium]MDQ5959799.1 2,3-cyclic 3-phosphodiesterase [Pseudomonadota bacterium]
MSTDIVVPPGARFFFALWLPVDAAKKLHTVAGGVVGRCGGRLMREDALHITLAFLGEVPERRLVELQKVAAEFKLQKAPVRLDRLGFWNHNHILWAGTKEPDPALSALAAELQDLLVKAGFLTDAKPFLPHVTLLRKLLHPGALPELPAVEWSAAEFVLAKSWPSDRGSAYETVARWPLN